MPIFVMLVGLAPKRLNPILTVVRASAHHYSELLLRTLTGIKGPEVFEKQRADIQSESAP
jgi:hypothetical protein